MSAVTWKTGISGDWNTAADWSGGAVPGASDSVTINAAGTYQVTLFGSGSAASLTLAAAGASFYEAGTLAVGGTIALSAGTLQLASSGTLSGGTLALSGGTLAAGGGTLDRVSVQGTLALTAAQASLAVRDGLTLAGAGGTGPGAIALTGGGAALQFFGSQALDNVSVTIGAVSQPGNPATLSVSHDATATVGSTLTLGSRATITAVGQGAVLSCGASGFLGPTLADTILNQGTILEAVAGGTLAIAGAGGFLNAGTISVSNGAVLSISSAGFTNTGSILVSGGTLALDGTFGASRLSSLTAAPGTLTLRSATVSITGTLDVAGGAVTLGSATALGPIALAGTIRNGMVIDQGGGLVLSPGSGVLDGVTYRGLLDLSAGGRAVTLTDMSTVQSGTGGAGTIALTGAGSTLFLQGNETLTACTIQLGSAASPAMLATSEPWLASAGTTATLAASVSVVQAGAYAQLMANGSTPIAGVGVADTLILAGTITGAVAGTLTLGGVGTIVNQGTISVSAGDTLVASAVSFANAGKLNVGAGGTAVLGSPQNVWGVVPGWSNAGTISVNGGTLVLAGSARTTQLGSLTVTNGGMVSLTGTLANAGSVLALGAGAAIPSLSLSGTIVGGTVSDAGGGLRAAGGVLDGVSLSGTLSLAQANARLLVRDGMALAGLVQVTGDGATLAVQGNTVLDGGRVSLGGTAAVATIDVVHDWGLAGASTLTLGPGLALTQTGALAAIGSASDIGGDAIVNRGTITGAVAGGTLTLAGAAFSNQGTISLANETLAIAGAGFSNTGALSVSAGTLALAGSLTLAGLGSVSLVQSTVSEAGTLDLGGGTLSLGPGSAWGTLSLTGTLRGGSVADAGSGLLAAGGATLDAVTWRGTLDLSRPFSLLTLRDGFTALSSAGGPGTIALTGAASALHVAGNQTLDRMTISIGAASNNYYGQPVASPTIACLPGTTLTLGSGCTVRQTNLVAQIGDSTLGNWTDAIVNQGTLALGYGASVDTIGSTRFTNAGSISVANGTTQIADASFTNAAGAQISVATGAALLFLLYEYWTAPGVGSASVTNAGTITDPGGAIREMTGGGLFPFVPMANVSGGRLKGWGIVDVPIWNNGGTIEASGGQLRLLEALSGTGTLQVDTGAILEPILAVPAGQTVMFQPGGFLLLDVPTSFSGTLGNFAGGERIDLANAVVTQLSLGAPGISFVSGGASHLLATASPLSGALFGTPDGHGGTTIGMLPQSATQSTAPTLTASASGEVFWAFPQGDVFAGPTGTLNHATIGDWSHTDSLDFTDLPLTGATLGYTQGVGQGTLSVAGSGHAASVTLLGTFTAASFHLGSDGHGGAVVTYSG